MPALGDYIGRLVADMAVGRVQADMESVRLAEYYSAHPLLRYLPAPRFRVSRIDLVVPVAVRDLSTLPAGGPRSLERVKEIFTESVRRHLWDRNVNLDAKELAAVSERLDRATAELADESASPAKFAGVVETLRAEVIAALPSRITAQSPAADEQPLITTLTEALDDAARLASLATSLDTGSVEVEVTAAGLQGTPASSLLRISLSLTEEGVEWRADEDGDRRLLPE